jgi:hypothetical protein
VLFARLLAGGIIRVIRGNFFFFRYGLTLALKSSSIKYNRIAAVWRRYQIIICYYIFSPCRRVFLDPAAQGAHLG